MIRSRLFSLCLLTALFTSACAVKAQAPKSPKATEAVVNTDEKNEESPKLIEDTVTISPERKIVTPEVPEVDPIPSPSPSVTATPSPSPSPSFSPAPIIVPGPVAITVDTFYKDLAEMKKDFDASELNTFFGRICGEKTEKEPLTPMTEAEMGIYFAKCAFYSVNAAEITKALDARLKAIAPDLENVDQTNVVKVRNDLKTLISTFLMKVTAAGSTLKLIKDSDFSNPSFHSAETSRLDGLNWILNSYVTTEIDAWRDLDSPGSIELRGYLRAEPVREFIGSDASVIDDLVSIEKDHAKNELALVYHKNGNKKETHEKRFSIPELEKSKIVCPGDSSEMDNKVFNQKGSPALGDALNFLFASRTKAFKDEEESQRKEGRKVSKVSFAHAAGLLTDVNQNEGWSNVTLQRQYRLRDESKASIQPTAEKISTLGEWNPSSLLEAEKASCLCYRDEDCN
jgi:hypothetical protein